jgi:hypothetical protein
MVSPGYADPEMLQPFVGQAVSTLTLLLEGRLE